ncbi:MAG TPA: sugar transferase [Thermoleophilaceae bacterium]|jgi:exopolysaccharide biosynthesis polyprenyl glycosylphosphotransferase
MEPTAAPEAIETSTTGLEPAGDSGGSLASSLEIPAIRRAARPPRELDAEARSASRPIREGEHTSEALGRDTLHRRLLAAADAASAGVALYVAIVAAGDTPRLAVLAMLPVVVLLSKLVGLYDRDEHVIHKTTLDETPSLLNVAMAFVLMVWLLDDQLAGGGLGKPAVMLCGCLLFVSMGLARTGARRLALDVSPVERLLVLGSGSEAERMRAKLATAAPLKAEVVGRVPVSGERQADRGEDVLGILPELDFVIRRHRVDRVVICPHGESSTDMLDTIRLVKALGVKVSVMPRLFEVVGSSVEFDDLGGLTLLGLRRYDLTKSSAFLKRMLDVAGATAGLVLLAPLFGVIAVAIKVTSRGPVFFRQKRVGRGGDAFAMLKFRTMYDGADRQKADLLHRNEADGFFKIANDPRVTPIGRWLRRTSLDELPQLVNVLRGEMSLVGPRPLVDEEDARIEGWFRRRLDVTPGMTGAWQVLGSSRIPMRDMVTIDYLYRANWSLWLDMKILLRTVPHVLRRRGL